MNHRLSLPISLLVIGISLILIGAWYRTNPEIEPERYEFEITARARDISKVPINNFLMEYSFPDNEGILNFSLVDVDFEVAVFNFPRDTNISKILLHQCEDNKCVVLDNSQYANKSESNQLIIKKSIPKKSDWRFDIFFKIKMEPSGTFIFQHSENKILGGYPIREDYFGPVNVKFDLKQSKWFPAYGCIGNCVYPKKGIIPIFEGKAILARFEETEANSFILSTERKSFLFLGDFLLALGISLLAVAIERFINKTEEV